MGRCTGAACVCVALAGTNVGLVMPSPTAIVGPFNNIGDLESSLDIQYITSIGWGNSNWFWTATVRAGRRTECLAPFFLVLSGGCVRTSSR